MINECIKMIKNTNLLEGAELKQVDIVAVASLMAVVSEFMIKTPKADERPYSCIPEITGNISYISHPSNVGYLMTYALDEWDFNCEIALMEHVKPPKGATKLDVLMANMESYLKDKGVDTEHNDILKSYRQFKRFIITPQLRNLINAVAINMELIHDDFDEQSYRPASAINAQDIEVKPFSLEEFLKIFVQNEPKLCKIFTQEEMKKVLSKR